MQSVSKNNHLDHLEMTVKSGLEFLCFLKSFHAAISTLGTSYKESFFPKITNSVSLVKHSILTMETMYEFLI